jgi:xanthine/CO dehydrogenase XdhC/CoxF family maturation factor
MSAVKVQDKDRSMALIQASRDGDETAARLLIDEGADINARDKDGWTALISASLNSHKAVAQLLIDKGADINARDKNGDLSAAELRQARKDLTKLARQLAIGMKRQELSKPRPPRAPSSLVPPRGQSHWQLGPLPLQHLALSYITTFQYCRRPFHAQSSSFILVHRLARDHPVSGLQHSHD